MAPTNISSVIVPTPSPEGGGGAYDLISLEDVKLELQISNGADDTWLGKVITRASRAIAQECTRVFQAQSYQEQFWATREPYPWQLPSGFFPLQLGAWPLASPPSPAGTAPPLVPTLTAGSGGSLVAGPLYARVTYVTPTGETAGSMEAAVTVGASGSLTIAAPLPDSQGIATGWNAYVGTKSFGEVKQNASPNAMGQSYTIAVLSEATTPLVPNYILAVENYPLAPQPLAEGVDFKSDYNASQPDFSKAWLTRLFHIDETPRSWSGLPILVQYQAGYAEIPDDLADAALQIVKAKWFGRSRDPNLRQENVAGAWEATYWFSSGPGSSGQFPPDVQAVIDRYRVPTLA